MFLFYKEKQFQIELTSEDFDAGVDDFLKELYIYYKPNFNSWVVPDNKIEELLLWFDRYKYNCIIQNSAEEKLQEIKNSYSRELEVYRDRSFDKSILTDNVLHKDFQFDSIQWRLKRNRVLDAYDAGTGKTFMNICTVSYLFQNNYIDSLFIISPIGIEYSWMYSMLEFVKFYKEEDFFIIDNETKFQPFAKVQDKKIIICSQHLIADLIVSYHKDKKKQKSRSKKRIRWNLIPLDIKKEWNKNSLAFIIDESDLFKNSEAQRTKAFYSISNQFEYRYEVTATPNINRFEDIYMQIHMLDKSIIPMSENAFKLWLAEDIDETYGKNKFRIRSYNTDRVHEVMNRMRFVFTRKIKEEIPEIATEVINEFVYLQLTDIQKQLYRKVVEEELFIMQEEYDEINWRLLLSKLHLMCQVFDNPLLMQDKVFKDDEMNKLLKTWALEADPKFIALQSKLNYYIDTLDEKIVIFDYHPLTLDLLYEKFKDKYNPVIIHGSLKVKDKKKDRFEKEYKFNNDPNCKLALLSSLTSSAGGNWNKDCHRILVYSCPLDTKEYEQLQNRTDRVTSNENSIVETFCYARTLDQFRVDRSMGRIDLSNVMGKRITQGELEKLLKGAF